MKKILKISLIMTFSIIIQLSWAQSPTPYCAASAYYSQPYYIAEVQVNGNIKTSGYQPAGTPGYSNFTTTTFFANAGSTMSLKLTSGSIVTSNLPVSYWKVWIDYNGDYDFTDAGEEVLSVERIIAGGTITRSVTLPANARSTRMRVGFNAGGPVNSCGSISYGEYEDYSFTSVIAAPIIGTITQATCAVPTGTVVLNGLPASGLWTINPGNIVGSGSSKMITGLTPGTKSFTVSNSFGTSGSSTSFVINNVIPTAPVKGTITQPTCSIFTGSVILNNLPIGTWTINPGNIIGSGPSKLVQSLNPGKYNFTVKNSYGCTSPASADVIINKVFATAPTKGTITQPTCTVATGSVVLTSLPATGYWTINPGNIVGYGTSKLVPGLNPGKYNFTVRNSYGCTSPASVDIVINPKPPVPLAPTVGTITQPNIMQATGSVGLSNLPSGNWTINPGGITGTGLSTSISLNPGNYTFTSRNQAGCVSPPSTNVYITDKYSKAVKGFYVNGFDTILGKPYEDSLLLFAQKNGFNYLTLYKTNIILKNFPLTDITSAQKLANFIKKAKTQYGIKEIGVTGENFNHFNSKIKVYNQQYPDPNQKIDVFNLEFEFWNTNSTAPWGTYCAPYLQLNGFTCDTAGAFKFYKRELHKIDSLANYTGVKSEAYLGWFNSGQGKQIVETGVDRLLVHIYIPKEYSYSAASNYSRVKTRLQSLASASQTVHFRPIYSSEPDFMQAWAANNPFFQPYTDMENSLLAETASWKNFIDLQGIQWYAYSHMPKKNMSLKSFAFADLNEANESKGMESTFIMYPNPTNDFLHLNFALNKPENVQIRMMDVQGKLIYSEAKNKFNGAYETTIDLRNQVDAIYILQIITETETIYRKVIVK